MSAPDGSTTTFTTEKLYRDDVMERNRPVPLAGLNWRKDENGAYILINRRIE